MFQISLLFCPRILGTLHLTLERTLRKLSITPAFWISGSSVILNSCSNHLYHYEFMLGAALTLSDIGWDLCEFRPKAPVYSVTNIIFSVINIKLDEQAKWSNQIERKQCWTNNHWIWSQAKWFKWLPILFCLCALNGKPDMTRPRKDKYKVLLNNGQNLYKNLYLPTPSPPPYPSKICQKYEQRSRLGRPTNPQNEQCSFFLFLFAPFPLK